MKSPLLKLLISTIAILVASYILPGVSVANFLTAALVAIVLGVLNVFFKPLLVLLTLPINILTLGLFTIFINVALIMFADFLISGFSVVSFLSALLFGIVVSLVSSFLNMLSK